MFIAGIFLPISIYMWFVPRLLLSFFRHICHQLKTIFFSRSCLTSAKIHPALTRGLVERPKNFLRPGSCKRLWLPILVLLATFAFTVWALLMVFHGTIVFTNNLNNVRDAGNDLFTLAAAKLVGVGPVANYVVSDLNETIRSSLAAIATSVNPTTITTGIQPYVDLLEGDLTAAEKSLGFVSTNASALTTAANDADAAYPPLRTVAATYVTNAGASLNQPNRFPTNNAAGATYQLATPITLPAPNAAISAQPATNEAAQAMVGVVGSKSEGATAAIGLARTQLANYNGTQVAAKISTAINESAAAAQAILVPPIQEALTSIQTAYNEQLLPLAGSIDSAAQQFNEVVQFLLKIDLGRNIGTIVLASFAAICLGVVYVAMLARSPRWVGHCLLASFTVGIICFLIGALYLSIGVVIGATCGALETNNLNALLPTINQVAGTDITPAELNALMVARTQCAAGLGGLQVAVEVIKALQSAGALPGNFDTAAVAKIQGALDQIEAFVNGTTGNQVDAAVNAAANEIPSKVSEGLQTAQTAIELAIDAVDKTLTSAIKPLVRQAQTDPYTTPLKNANTQISALAAPGGTVGKAQSSDPARLAEAVALLQAAAASLQSTWNNIDANQGSTVKNANGEILNAATGGDAALTAFRGDMSSFSAHSVDLANVTLRLVAAEAANFTTYGLPPIKSAMKAFGAGAKDIIASLVACKNIIQDTYIIQNAVCIGVSRASDELWLGFVILGFVWTVGTILLFYALKKVWNTDSGWRWKGRKAPMSLADGDRYLLTGEQKIHNVEPSDVHGGEWSAFSAEAPKYEASSPSYSLANGAAAAPMAVGVLPTPSPVSGGTPAVNGSGYESYLPSPSPAFAVPEMSTTTPVSGGSRTSAV